MAYKAKIKNTVYDLKDGFTLKDELNETLDSGTIQFNTYNGETDCVSFDNVEIYDTANKINKKYLEVDSYDDEVYSFGANFESDNHSYIMTLFSETKELERVPLPNCSVTQPILENLTKKTVYDEILRFYDIYVPIIKVYDAEATNHYKYVRQFVLDPDIQTRFGSIICPEFQWNNPTLREVFNDLMSTDDCIVVMKQGVISFYDLKEKGSPIDTTKLSYSKKSMSSSDYVGELVIDMQNAIGKNKTICCEYLTLRAPDGTGTLTTENGVLTTQHPIYAIKKLVCYAFDTRLQNIDNHVPHCLHKINVTDRIKEYDDWNLLSTVKVGSSTFGSLADYTDANGLTTKMHKLYFLYYERNGRQIKNLGTLYSATVGSGAFSTAVVAATCVELGTLPNAKNLGAHGSTSSDIDPREMFFYIEYETIAEHSMKVGKYLPSEHPENRVFDNQSNSYVDIEHQSIFEYAKVNRLGNKIREIYGEFFSEDGIPQLGDYIGEEILFSREITYYDHIIYFKGYLTPHYVLKDFFTGVRAKKRSWQIAKESDALTRHDVYKLYVEASYNYKTDLLGSYHDYPAPSYPLIKSIDPTNNVNLIEVLISICDSYQANNVKWALSRTEIDSFGPEYLPSSNEGIVLDTDIEIQGMSLCFNIGFNDNFKSADYVIKEDNEYTQSFYAYADENGEFIIHYVALIGQIYGVGDGETLLPKPLEDGGVIEDEYLTLTQVDNILKQCYPKPKINISGALYENYGIQFNLKVRKDNREIIQNTIQYEFCSDNKNIIVTKRLINFSRMFNESNYNKTTDIKIFVSYTQKYQINDEDAKGDYRSDLTIQKTLRNQSIGLTVVYNQIPVAVGQFQSWCVADSNNKILIACNVQSGQTNLSCVFNLLKTRDDKVYSSFNSNEVVGDITDAGLALLANPPLQELTPIHNVHVLRRVINLDDIEN